MTDPIEAAPVAAGAAAPLPSAKRPRTVFAGYTAPQLLLAFAVLAIAIWGMWVTRAITNKPAPQRIVKADLSRIVGDYVQAQSRSATPARPGSVPDAAVHGEPRQRAAAPRR